MKIEKGILDLLEKENFKDITNEEKELVKELFATIIDEDGIIDCRYEIDDRFFIECYGKRIENEYESFCEVDFYEDNYFRFYDEENGEVELSKFLDSIEN